MGNVLVVAEQHSGQLKRASLSAITFGRQAAQQTGGSLHLAIIGHGVEAVGRELATFSASDVHVLDTAALEHPLAAPYAAAVAELAKHVSAEIVCAAATAQTKDYFPRVAARLGAGMVSDALAIVSPTRFRRPMWAGNALAEVEVVTPVRVVTVRTTEFVAAKPNGAQSPIRNTTVELGKLPATTFVERRDVKSERPELTEARVIVAGGRGVRGGDGFKQFVEPLADLLGAAVGASRAAVDAGWVPNDWQIGQTGKVVAPDLYIGVGISGAIQHVAGMKGARVIVAINKDPEAPIFQIADYGLVADLTKAVPELVEAIRVHKTQQ